LILVTTSHARSRRFATEAGEKLATGDYAAVLEIAKRHERSHLAAYIRTGVETFLVRQREGKPRDKAAELAKRAMERRGENLSESLHRGLNVLASTGSTAPFIGLLGTVLGILNAFRLIGEEASGGMGTIGPAISEALIVTGYGLLVAIPAVLFFNWLSGRIGKYEAGLANAGSELGDQLEAGASASVERVEEELPARVEPMSAAALS
jgi:biopolymer transport protein ExbB/TolQ